MTTKEIFLDSLKTSKEEWQSLINTISNYNGIFKKWKIIILIKNNNIRFFIETKCSLPPIVNNLNKFQFKDSKKIKKIRSNLKILNLTSKSKNIIDLINYYEIKNKGNLKRIELEFIKIFTDKVISKVSIYTKKENIIKKEILPLVVPSYILEGNFSDNKRYYIKKAPKYLEINKILHLLKTDNNKALLKVDTFPFIQGDFYLNQNNYNFDKHSIIVGSSGCGKSKLISLIISNIIKDSNQKNKYKFVVIDPHASLENDIGGLGKVIDFKTDLDSIDLFINSSEDTTSTAELLLDLLKSLISDQYNSKLERVLRHSIHLLLISKSFNFRNLRKLILDIEYREELINNNEKLLPISVIDFFRTDFNDLKTKYYTEAISPVIAFIDEMEMLPVFNTEKSLKNLKETIQENYLTLISLDRTKLGDKVTKTISGLIMQQLFLVMERKEIKEKIIFIIDEVPVIENKILSRYLSESRKYNLSLFLITQYFNQISEDLKNSIFANVSNYYIFRVSKLDAGILVDNFNMKLASDDTRENKMKLLTELNNRELIARIENNDILLPAFKGKTIDFKEIPRVIKKSIINEVKKEVSQNKYINFKTTSNIKLSDILIKNSTKKGIE